VTVDLDDYRRALPREVQALYRAVFDASRQAGWKTIALPLLGAGDPALIEMSVLALASAIRDHLRFPAAALLPSTVVVTASANFDEVRACLQRRLPRSALGLSAAGLSGAAASTAVLGLLAPGVGTAVGAVLGSVLGPFFRAKVDAAKQRGDAPSPSAKGAALSQAFAALLLKCAEKALAEMARLDRAPEARAELPSLLVSNEDGALRLDATAPEAPVSDLLAAAVFAWACAGRPFPPEIVGVLRDALGARNRLVNAPTGGGEEDLLVVAEAIERLEPWLDLTSAVHAIQPEPPSWSGMVATPGASAVAHFEHLRDLPLVSAARIVPKPALPRLAAPSPLHGTQQVHKLRRLLKERLPPAALADLLERLDHKKYSGDDDRRLLEYCVQEEDLGKLLCDEFSVADLRRILREETGLEPGKGAAKEDLAGQLLEHLGFRSSPPCHGLLAVRRLTAEMRSRLSHEPDETLQGKVAGVVYDIERLLRLYVQFLCRWLFETDPNSYLHATGRLKPSYVIDRCTTGDLVGFIRAVERELRTSDDTRAVELRRGLSERPFLPPEAGELAELRNAVIHMRVNGRDEKLEPAEVRASSERFFDRALRVLDHMAEHEGRVFPFVVRIDSIHVDRYGRRTIKASSDGEVGKLVETIFTEAQIVPGELYLMRPLTNPWRVDPVLVRAGDLGRPSAGR
jgi:hypothetical protein